MKNKVGILLTAALIACLSVGCTAVPEGTGEPVEIVARPTEPESPPLAETATAKVTEPANEQLAVYQALFEGSGDWIFNRATGYEYTRPEDVDLYYLFYHGVGYEGSWNTLPESERDLLVNHGFCQEIGIQIMPADLLDEKLQQYFGVGLDDAKIPVEWAYSAETDTYYSNHSDAYSHLVTVTGCTDQPDGTVTLHLIVDAAHDHAAEEIIWDAAMDMTLRPVDGAYQIVSNVLVT